MLLNKLIIATLLLAPGSMAFAEPNLPLKHGLYELSIGERDFCGSDIEIDDSSVKNDVLILGAKESFVLKPNQQKTKSSLDENCEFNEVTQRKDDNSSTTLRRLNEEICKGKRISKSEATVVLSRDSINMVYKDDGKVLGSCIYKLK